MNSYRSVPAYKLSLHYKIMHTYHRIN